MFARRGFSLLEVLLAFAIFTAACVKFSDPLCYLVSMVQQLTHDTEQLIIESNQQESQA